MFQDGLMMINWRRFITPAIFAIIGLALGLAFNEVSAHHNANGILPGIPNTPAIQHFTATGQLTHCVDSEIANYPGFIGQIQEANDAATARLNVWHVILGGTYSTASAAAQAGCQIWWDGRNDNFCSGCAADVQYSNAPVTIRVKLSLGYVHWVSTTGHEMGHVYGMHEGYDDIKFVSHINTYGRWAPPWNAQTVMDFGTTTVVPPRGVWALTEADYRIATQWLHPAALAAGRDRLADGRKYVWYCGRNTSVTTSIAIFGVADFGLYWLNLYREQFDTARCPDGSYGGSFFLPDWIQDWYSLVIRQGNVISWDWTNKGDTFIQ